MRPPIVSWSRLWPPSRRTITIIAVTSITSGVLAYGAHRLYRRLKNSVKDKEHILDQVSDIVRDILSLDSGELIPAQDVIAGIAMLKYYRAFENRPFVGVHNIETNKETAEKGLRHMRYASAAYGWKMINKLFFDLEIESTPVGNIAVLNAEMLKTHTKIPVEDLIMYQWDSDNVFLPAHYLAVDKAYKTIVVAIRGTMDIADVINDLVCEYVTYDGGETHSGFLLCAQGIYKNVKDDLIELHKKYPEYEISVVGHSLGAGTATLLTCLIDVENEGFNPHCYAFGPPGIFDLETASSDRMKKLVTSYVCGDDIVCRLSHGHMRETKSAAAWFVRNKPKNAAVVTNLIKEQLLRFKTDPPPENEMKKLDPSKLTYYHYPKLYPVGDIKYLKMKVPSTTSNPSSTDDLINTANDAVKQRTAQQNATIDKFGDGDATPEPEKSDVEVSGSRGRGIFARIGYWYTSFFAKFGKRATKIDKHSGERVDVVDIVVIGNVESKDFGQMVLSRNMLMHHMPWVYEQALIKSIESISSNTSSESSQPSEEGLDKEGVEELKEVAKDAIEN